MKDTSTVIVTPGGRILINAEAWLEERTAGIDAALTAELRAIGEADEAAGYWTYRTHLASRFGAVTEHISDPGDWDMLTAKLGMVAFERGAERYVMVEVQHPNLKECWPPTVYRLTCEPEQLEVFEYDARCANGHSLRMSQRRLLSVTAAPPAVVPTSDFYDPEGCIRLEEGRPFAVCPVCFDEYVGETPLELTMVSLAPVEPAATAAELPPELRALPRDEADALMVSAQVLKDISDTLELARQASCQEHTVVIVREDSAVIQTRPEGSPVRSVAVVPETDGRFRLSRTWLAATLERQDVTAAIAEIEVEQARAETQVSTGEAKLWTLPTAEQQPITYVLELPGVTVRLTTAGAGAEVAIDAHEQTPRVIVGGALLSSRDQDV